MSVSSSDHESMLRIEYEYDGVDAAVSRPAPGSSHGARGETAGAAETSGVIAALGGVGGEKWSSDSPPGISMDSRRPSGPHSSPPASDPALSANARERAQAQQMRRKVILAAGCVLCLFVTIVGGFICMAVFGGMCAASLGGSGKASWACGGGGAVAATFLLVIGLAPFAVLLAAVLYNTAYFVCCGTRPTDPGRRRCCGVYKELAW